MEMSTGTEKGMGCIFHFFGKNRCGRNSLCSLQTLSLDAYQTRTPHLIHPGHLRRLLILFTKPKGSQKIVDKREREITPKEEKEKVRREGKKKNRGRKKESKGKNRKREKGRER